jgi:hypothetical protein
MTIPSVLIALPLFCALMPGALQASAQTTPQATVKGPVAIASPKDDHCFRGEVIAATNASITARDRQDERCIHTFTYSPNLAAKMQHIIAHGNYQPGDKVEISCHGGNNEAYSIKGKPSVFR